VLAAVGILMVALVAILAVLAALDVAGIRRLLPGRGGGDPQVIRMAVLPFVNMTGDPEQEYLADGITQELISQLGRLHPDGLSVIARSSVMRYRNGDTPIDQIGRELGVDYVLEGSTRREAARVRITTELIQVWDQTQLWADTYERELASILALQSEVAEQVAGALALELLPAEEARLASSRMVDPEAYEAYLKGTYHSERLELDTAERYFELALEKDPSYAPAYAGLAGVWATRQQMGFMPPHEAGPKAKAAALRAIELDDRSAAAHGALAAVLTWTDWDWEGAEPEWRRTLELNPSDADTHAFYAHFLANTGRADEAIPHSERSLELDPVNAFFKGMYAVVLSYNNRYKEALGLARTAVAMQPNNPLLLSILWHAEFRTGNFEEAVTTVKTHMGVMYADPTIEEALDGGWVDGGYTEAIRRAAAALETRKRTSFVLPTDIALLWAEAGEHDKTLEWLERGFEVHDPAMPYIGLPVFDLVRDDPRFHDLLRRMNLPSD
jgi:TolB-like protein/Tfp pilus assembly protein PilF